MRSPTRFPDGTWRLAAAFAVVVVGLASRAIVDRLLAQTGGGERVAAWAQLQSSAELVTSVCAAGVGAGLTVLVAAGPQRSALLMRAATAIGLGISALALFAFAVAALAFGARLGSAPIEPALIALAATAGWFAVMASLAASLWAGQQRQGRVLLLASIAGALSWHEAGMLQAQCGLPRILCTRCSMRLRCGVRSVPAGADAGTGHSARDSARTAFDARQAGRCG